MAEFDERNEESLILFDDQNEGNKTENISEAERARKQSKNISEIDKATTEYGPTKPTNTVDKNVQKNTETETELEGVRRSERQKAQSFTDRESVENEKTHRQKHILGGLQGRVTTVINQLMTCITERRAPSEIITSLEPLEKAMQGCDDAYRK